MYNQWLTLCSKINGAKTPSRILSELNRSSSILRDLFDDQFKGVYCNDKNLCYELKDYIQQIAPKKKSVVKFYKSDKPIFEHFKIERQIKSAFGRTVSMSKGAYLIIEHTEALHVIDVNSGNRSNKSENQEDTALEVNLIAATEIARQLRLRDMAEEDNARYEDVRSRIFAAILYGQHFNEVVAGDVQWAVFSGLFVFCFIWFHSNET